jgi:alpha-glucosidase (family GH31 glycosyl hydrolase)
MGCDQATNEKIFGDFAISMSWFKLSRTARWLSWLPLIALCAMTFGSVQASGLTWQVTPSPFLLTFINDGGTLASEIDAATIGAGGRLSYKSGGTVANNTGTSFHLTNLISQTPVANGMSYSVATNEANRTANVTIKQTTQGVRVEVSFVGAGTGAVTTVWEAINAGAAEHYLSGSSAAHVDLRGWIRAWRPGKEGNHVEEYCKNQAEVATPYYFSSGGYGFYAETANVGRFSFPGADPNAADGPNCANTPSVPSGATAPQACPFNASVKGDRVQVCLRGAQLTYHIFDGSPSTVTEDYYATVGLPLLPPPVQYGLWKWRDVNANQAQVLSDVSSFINNNIPITGVWIDNPWEVQPTSNTTRQNGSACTNSGAFDSRFFPDPQGMINTVHSQGVLFGLWVGPNVVGPGGSSVTGGGTCTTNPQWNANHWFIPGTNYIDFTNQAAWQAWVNLYTPLFSMGVDMAKEDRAEEYQLETATLALGSGATLYTEFPAFYHSAVTQTLRNARVARGLDSEGFVTFVRTAFTGDAQVTHGMWASDMYHDFTALQAAVRLGISQSLTGAPASWGSDTGGIDPRSPATNSNSPTKTAFVRWAQFSALSSALEVGGAGLNQDPVGNYDATTINRFRNAVVLHYEFIPYIYGLAQQAAMVGLPVMRGVGFHYAADPSAWAQDQEFMLGSNLLVAPVTGPTAEADGAAGNPTNVPVYLPVGAPGPDILCAFDQP